MTGEVRSIAGVRVLCYPAEGATLAGGADALDLIAAAMGQRVSFVVLPVERLDRTFFELSSGAAGEIVQKLVNYGVRLAVLGDIDAWLCDSKSFRDFVRECNRGRQLWFVGSAAEIEERLAQR